MLQNPYLTERERARERALRSLTGVFSKDCLVKRVLLVPGPQSVPVHVICLGKSRRRLLNLVGGRGELTLTV